MKYLRATYRKPRKIDDVYDYLSRTSLAKWFYPNGELEENYKRYVGLGTTFASAQHSPILDAQLVLKEEICEVLKKHRAARQPLSVVCIQEAAAISRISAENVLGEKVIRRETYWMENGCWVGEEASSNSFSSQTPHEESAKEGKPNID